MPASTPGRNDPCPCGSGRKFKQCCIDARSKEDSARIRVRTLEGRVINALMDYIVETWGEALVDSAWGEFFLWDDVPTDLGGTPEFSTMFVPWLTLGYVPDVDPDDTEAADWPQAPIGLHWMTAETPDLDAAEREYIRIACESPMSAFVVEVVTPGRSVDLKDILTGRRFHCLEQGATETVRPNQLMFTRIVTMDGASVMLGAAPWVITDEWHTRVIDFREALVGTRLMTREDLEEHELAIRNLYLEIAAEILNPAPPRLTNTDGDELEWATLTYDVSGSLDHIVEALVPLAKAVAGAASAKGTRRSRSSTSTFVVDEAARDEDGRLTSATVSWVRQQKRKGKPDQTTVLGTINLAPGRMVADVNSAERARTLKVEFAALLETRAVLIDTKVTDMAAALAESAARREAGGAPAEVEPTPEASPELEEMKAEMLRRHVMGWLEEKIPALGGKTPRQAARTAGGRERLEALLAGYEDRMERMSPGAGAFVREIRSKLGLP